MALQINTNTGALMASAAASSVNKSMETSMERLSTGLRINSASDDAAGVAIASRLSSEIRGINQAIRNAGDAQALIDTAEGAHSEIENILQRMRELAIQAANDTNSSNDRTNIQTEIDQLAEEIDRISSVTTWAGNNLLNGTGSANTTASFAFHIGQGDASADSITVTVDAVDSSSLGLSGAAVLTNIASVSGAFAGTQPDIGSSGSYEAGSAAGSGSYTISSSAGTIEFSGSFADTTTIVINLDGSDYTYTVDTGAISGGSGDVAADFADWIVSTTRAASPSSGASALDGITASVSGDTVTIVQTATAVQDNDNGTLTFTDGFASGDSVSASIDGVSVSISIIDDGYANTAAGVAEQFADAVRDTDALSAINVSVSAGVITYTKGGAISVSTSANAQSALADIDAAIQTLNSQRSTLGAVSNRLDSTINNLTNVATNLETGRSRIQDADFATESTSLAKNQILQQASTAMLAQANASKQNVLALLQG
jgi:flagellin